MIAVYCHTITFYCYFKYCYLRGGIAPFYRRENEGAERCRGSWNSNPRAISLHCGLLYLSMLAQAGIWLPFYSFTIRISLLLSTFYDICFQRMFMDWFSSGSGTLLGARNTTVNKSRQKSLPSWSLYSS